MSSFKKSLAAAAVVVLTATSASLAADARYEVKRISTGPRPDQYVLVRKAPVEQPYALTGTEPRDHRPRTVWATPLHPKGPRSGY